MNRITEALKNVVKRLILYSLKRVFKRVLLILLPYLFIFIVSVVVILSVFGAAPVESGAERDKEQVISMVERVEPEIKSEYGQEQDFDLDWGIVYAVEMYANGWKRNIDMERIKRIIEGLKPEFSYREYIEKTCYYDESNHLYREVEHPVTLLIEVDTYKGRYVFSYREKRDITYFYVSNGEETERHRKEHIYVVPDEVEFYEDYFKLDKVLLAEVKKRFPDIRGFEVEGGELTWPLPSGRVVTSNFGYRFHPVDKVYRFHTGIDIAANIGDDVVAAADGVVAFAGRLGAFGKCVILQHPGNVQTLYAHNSKNIVEQGEAVKRGQKIAEVGSAGKSTGPHLHFEVRINGRSVNPLGNIEVPGGILNIVNPVDRRMVLETASAFMKGKSSLEWLKEKVR
mgnify:CR=1 FL=1